MVNLKFFNKTVLKHKPSKFFDITYFIFCFVATFVLLYFTFYHKRFRGFDNFDLNHWKYFFGLYKEEKNNGKSTKWTEKNLTN